MKKWIVLFLIAVLPFIFGFSIQHYQAQVIKMKKAAGDASCDPLGTAELYWDGEHTTSTVTACVSGGTKTGTLSGATISQAQARDTNSLLLNADDDYMSFPITTKDIFDSAAGSVSVWIYADETTTFKPFFEAYHGANDMVQAKVNIDNTIWLKHKGDGSSVVVESTDTISDDTWTNIQIRWSVSENKIGIKVAAGDWLDDSDGDAVTALSTEPTVIKLGATEIDGGINDFFVDDFWIWVTYDQS